VVAEPMTAERAAAVFDVVAMLAWSSACRAVPVDDARRLASDPEAPEWLRAFAAFRQAIEDTAPPAPAETPIAELCSSCVSAEAVDGDLCALCRGFRELQGYMTRGTSSRASARSELQWGTG
jgi:hypothetical protein